MRFQQGRLSMCFRLCCLGGVFPGQDSKPDCLEADAPKFSGQLASSVRIGSSARQPLNDWQRRGPWDGVGCGVRFDTPSVVRLDGSHDASMLEDSLHLGERLFSIANPHENKVTEHECCTGGTKGEPGRVGEYEVKAGLALMAADPSFKKRPINVEADGSDVRDGTAEFLGNGAWATAKVKDDRSSLPVNLSNEKLASGLGAPCLLKEVLEGIGLHWLDLSHHVSSREGRARSRYGPSRPRHVGSRLPCTG